MTGVSMGGIDSPEIDRMIEEAPETFISIMDKAVNTMLPKSEEATKAQLRINGQGIMIRPNPNGSSNHTN